MEGCSVIHLSKTVQRFSYQAGCLDPGMQLPSPKLLASYSRPLCPVGSECSMNILQLQLAELICLPLIVRLKCLFLKACGSGEQLHDSGVAGVVRSALDQQ